MVQALVQPLWHAQLIALADATTQALWKAQILALAKAGVQARWQAQLLTLAEATMQALWQPQILALAKVIIQALWQAQLLTLADATTQVLRQTQLTYQVFGVASHARNSYRFNTVVRVSTVQDGQICKWNAIEHHCGQYTNVQRIQQSGRAGIGAQPPVATLCGHVPTNQFFASWLIFATLPRLITC